MQRSPAMKVLVHCSHHQRTVHAVRNAAIDRLVSCEEADRCRMAPVPTSGVNEVASTFPRGCAVYPSLAK